MATSAMENAVPIEILCWEGYDDPLLVAPHALAGGEAVHADAHVGDHDAAQRVLAHPGRWDILNINSPFVRALLHPRGRIRTLDAARFGAAADGIAMPPAWRALQQWGRSDAGEIIGLCQRFGPFNLVVDTNAISVDAAEDQGFALAADPRYAGRYGILAYNDFNVLHIAMASGLDPFVPLTEEGFARYEATAARWFAGAKLVTADHLALNRALLAGDIAFHLGGGIYTASCARREGHARIRAITPRRGPLDGHGGIAFVEVNALLEGAPHPRAAEDFLAYLLQPVAAVRASLAAGAANPVLQMSEARVFAQYDAATLDAMQWDTLDAELERCAQYRIAPDYPRLHAILVAARAAAGWADVN